MTILDGPETPYIKEMAKHKKNTDLGTKKTVFSSQVYIDQVDAASFEMNEEVHLLTDIRLLLWTGEMLLSLTKCQMLMAKFKVLR